MEQKEASKHKCWENWQIILKCTECGTTVDSEASPYATIAYLERFFSQRGFEIVASGKIPKQKRCEGIGRLIGHSWDGRDVAGIPFRKCKRCGLTQRMLYEPYFMDFKIDDKLLKGWDKFPATNPRNMRKGERSTWT